MNPLFLDDPVNVVPTDPPPTTSTRVAFQWPFTSASAWNIPIASSATFADDPKIRLGGAAINATTWTVRIHQSSGTDPLVATTWSGHPTSTLRIASGVTSSAGGDGDLVVVLADGHTLYDLFQFVRNDDTHATANRIVQNAQNDAVTGTGWGNPTTGTPGGCTAASGSWAGGIMRSWELSTPGNARMKHCLRVGLDKPQLKQAATQAGTYQWPAITSDGFWATYAGSIKMGSLLAIPKTVDITTLGLPNADALALAWTLQNFGCYVVDKSGSGSGAFTLYAEIGAPATIVNNIRAGLATIRSQLRLVTNNTATTIGGKTPSGTYPASLYPAPTPVAVTR